MRYEIRELKVGGILDQAINLVKDHFWSYLIIAALLALPFNLISGFYVHWMVDDVADTAELDMTGAAAPQVGAYTPFFTAIGIIGLLTLVIVYPLTNAAITYATANTYLSKPVSVGSAWRRALRVFLPLLGTWLLAGLAIMGGFMVLGILSVFISPLVIPLGIIPAIILMFWFLLASQVVVIEGISGLSALKRSRQLMKGNIGTAFVLGILVAVINWFTGVLQQVIPQPEVSVLVASLIETVIIMFTAAVWVVFYFSCRCKAENFDLTVLAEAVAKEDAALEQ